MFYVYMPTLYIHYYYYMHDKDTYFFIRLHIIPTYIGYTHA